MLSKDKSGWFLVVGILIGSAIGHIATWPHAYRAGLRHGQEMAPPNPSPTLKGN